MTLIVGNVVDVGLRGLDGALRVWAWFRPEEVGLIAPYRREWEIRQGEIEPGVDVVPGPAVVEVDCGPDAYTSVEVTVPDAESVSLKDLFEQVYAYTPPVVSEAYAERLRAEVAAVAAEESAGVALGAERGARAAESGAALSAATLSARVEQPGQDILYTSDGKPYFADPAQIENVPLRVDTSVGTRVMLGDTMLKGDTGWRDIGALLINGWALSATGGGLWVRRVNDVVMFEGSINGMESTDSRIANIPVGLRPGRPAGGIGYIPAFSNSGTTITGWPIEYHRQWAAFRWHNEAERTRSSIVRFALTALTTDNWPTSLPGVPA